MNEDNISTLFAHPAEAPHLTLEGSLTAVERTAKTLHALEVIAEVAEMVAIAGEGSRSPRRHCIKP